MRIHFIKLLLVILLTACGEPNMPSPYHAVDVTWQHPQANFHLTDFNGIARDLTDFRGKVIVLFFGYTHCPEVCPTTLADLSRVMRSLGPDADKVQVLFVTLDPERDTSEVLKKYIPSFYPTFLGLYGDDRATIQAARTFGVNFEKHTEKNGDYTLDHSDGTFLIGMSGKPVLLSPYDQHTDLLVQDIRLLLTVRQAHRDGLMDYAG